MGAISRIRTLYSEPSQASRFFRKIIEKRRIKSSLNEIVLLVKRGKLIAITCYFVTAIRGDSVYEWFLNRRRERDGDKTIVKARNYEMWINLRDFGISKGLLLYGTWEDGPASIYEQELQKLNEEVEEPVVVDAGANIGYYTILSANAVEKGEVIAIEPNRENYNMLIENVEHNEVSRIVSTYKCALGSTNGTGKLLLADESNLHTVKYRDDQNSTSTSPSHDDTDFQTVEVYSLDNFISDRGYDYADINAIRMDFEGNEVEALNGMSSILNADGPLVLYVEVHNHILSEEDSRRLPELLDNAGFEIIAVEWGETSNSPFGLSYDVTDWSELPGISNAYSLIGKKNH